MAMMASGQTATPAYDDDHAILDEDFLNDGAREEDTATELFTDWVTEVEPDEPSAATTDRTPLTGNIGSSNSRSAPLNQSYLTSRVPGEDRRAQLDTLDESVWDTLSRDLRAVWEKLRQVLWPKYLLGGMLSREGTGTNDLESGNAIQGFGRDLRGIVGRWPDADGILHGAMSEGLRDWDLWWVACKDTHNITPTDTCRGPLIFCLLLSLFLSIRASKDQTDIVFSGVFSMVWIGEAVVTLQIKLLGGNMYVHYSDSSAALLTLTDLSCNQCQSSGTPYFPSSLQPC